MREAGPSVIAMWRQRLFGAAVVLGLLTVSALQAAETAGQLVQPLEVRKLVADGKHNAFTALVRFQDRFWLAFRSATAHNSADGDIVLLESADAQTWRESVRFNVARDDRDPQFLVAGRRLLLYVPGMTGHCVHTFRGVTYVCSRSMDYSTRKTGTMIYIYAGGQLRPYCELPAGGDCSYAEAVLRGDEMLVSYYSSHEGTTNVYLARVPLAP